MADEEVFSTLKRWVTYLQHTYTAYARMVDDEGLRKFLHSMAEQESSHQQYLKEEMEKTGEQSRSSFAEVLDAHEAPQEAEQVGQYTRIEFLEHAMKMEMALCELYRALSEAAENEELSTFFHSMHIEEKRHYNLVKDRYELESLLSS